MPARKVFVGNIYPTTKGGNVIVLDYVRDKHILVEFMDENKHQTITDTTALTKGLIHNPYAHTFYGVGFMGVGRFSTNPKSDTYKAYKGWDCMLNRCYSESHKARHPSTILSNCCSEWFNCQVFCEWYVSQRGWNQPKWQLDKDLMGNGLMTYSPDTCVIVPPIINTSLRFLNQGSRNKSGLPHGVCYLEDSKYYITDCRVYGQKGKPRTMYFRSEEDAFFWFKENKEKYLKAMALDYRDRVEDRVFHKLMSLEIPSPF